MDPWDELEILLQKPGVTIIPLLDSYSCGMKPLSDKYLAELKEYYGSLGYMSDLNECIVYDPDTRIYYKTLKPNGYRINDSVNYDINMCHLFNWTAETYNSCLELPLELIPKFIWDKLQKVS